MTEYKGQLQGFPKEIINKMLECQVQQGNEKDAQIFEVYLEADKSQKGFTWYTTVEGENFWRGVIKHKNFNLFFEKYPKYPKVMWVSDYSEVLKINKRVVFMEKNNKYIAWDSAETLEEAKLITNTCIWSYAEDIEEEVLELTIDQIAEKFNVDSKLVKIVK